MNIQVTQTGSRMVIELSGWLDSNTAPELDSFVRSSLSDVHELVFDLNGLEYISSAGLRVLLYAQKTMNKQGSMTVRGCSSDVMEIFDITGFSDLLTIE